MTSLDVQNNAATLLESQTGLVAEQTYLPDEMQTGRLL